MNHPEVIDKMARKEIYKSSWQVCNHS